MRSDSSGLRDKFCLSDGGSFKSSANKIRHAGRDCFRWKVGKGKKVKRLKRKLEMCFHSKIRNEDQGCTVSNLLVPQLACYR